MSNPTLPEDIIGALPDPEDQILPDDEGDDLPPEIVGTLPSLNLNHRLQTTNFYPDGQVRICTCGFSTGVCHDEIQAEMEFLAHLVD